MSVIKIDQITKKFGKNTAVDNVSFSIEKGEIFGFLGPNGAGKTTTIRCLMDFIRPTMGEVKVFGLDSRKDSTKIKEKIGFLSADVNLYENWNGWDHIYFAEKLRGKKAQNLENLIKQFEYNPSIKVKNLSTGNKQKLAVILALMHEPELLILDEPTRGLDPLLQNKIYEILLDLKAKGKTIFMSSHILPEVERICDRVAIIKEGKLVAVENVSGIKNKKVSVVNVSFATSFSKKDFELEGVEIVNVLDDGLTLQVRGDINPLVKRFANYKIKDLEITHSNLEEMFLEFYKEQE